MDVLDSASSEAERLSCDSALDWVGAAVAPVPLFVFVGSSYCGYAAVAAAADSGFDLAASNVAELW